MTGFVYFLQAGSQGPVKIGFSATSVERRIRGNQVGCPQPLTLLGVVEGDVRLERRFHKAFRAASLRGEWFKPHPLMMTLIQKVAKPLPGAGAGSRPENSTALEELAWVIDVASTRSKFAEAVGIGQVYLSQLLSGKRPLSRLPGGTLLKFSKLSGIPMERLAAPLEAAE